MVGYLANVALIVLRYWLKAKQAERNGARWSRKSHIQRRSVLGWQVLQEVTSTWTMGRAYQGTAPDMIYMYQASFIVSIVEQSEVDLDNPSLTTISTNISMHAFANKHNVQKDIPPTTIEDISKTFLPTMPIISSHLHGTHSSQPHHNNHYYERSRLRMFNFLPMHLPSTITRPDSSPTCYHPWTKR